MCLRNLRALHQLLVDRHRHADLRKDVAGGHGNAPQSKPQAMVADAGGSG